MTRDFGRLLQPNGHQWRNSSGLQRLVNGDLRAPGPLGQCGLRTCRLNGGFQEGESVHTQDI